MKAIVKGIYSLINKVSIGLRSSGVNLDGSKLYKLRCDVSKGNTVQFKGCQLDKSRVSVKGTHHEVTGGRAFVSNCQIQFEGQRNKLTIEDGVKLRNAIVIVRGTDCSVRIGKGTTFGGVRIVNVGKENAINIGEGCLFADNIEIWASDTHSIFNEAGEMINKERPIEIGDNVWVGSHAFILKGVTIKNDSVIGMGTKVTKDIPSNTISVGSPNKVIKEGVTWKIDY